MASELEALVAEQRGDLATALAKANEAASREQDTPSGFGPPVPAKPARELLGEILARAGRPGEAQSQLARALARTPRRAITLEALAQAARAGGDHATAETTLATLRDVWSRADDGLIERADGGQNPEARPASARSAQDR
jgi:predicted Zn-dependent protease